MRGHVLKYKTKDGKWVTVPVFYQSMYNAYKDYCETQNPPIEPVDEKTYYDSVGRLSELVENLHTNAGSITQLIEAIKDSGGALPAALGGTGVSIRGTADDANASAIVKNWLRKQVLCLSDATDTFNPNYINSIGSSIAEYLRNHDIITTLFPANNIHYGTVDPMHYNDLDDNCTYYFQIEN